MRRCLAFRLRVFFSDRRLPLLLIALALLMGLEALGTLRVYSRRVGPLEARAALALLLDVRHFFPLAGAAWSAAWFGTEIDGKGAKLLLSRGCGRFPVYGSSYFLFFGGLAAVSLLEQGFVLLAGVPGWRTLSPALLLRDILLRLLLDLGMAALPGFLPYLSSGSPYARLLGFPYGLALWRLMGSHYALWLPEAGAAPDRLALWPIPALLLGPLGYFLCSAGEYR